MPVPAVRRPGTLWIELPRLAEAGAEPVGHVRIGYARAQTAQHSLDAQHDLLTAAGATRLFSEKCSTRSSQRPELENAVALAREIRFSGAAVTLVLDEHRRLGQSIVLARLAEELDVGGIALQFLTGDLKGTHDPGGGVFTVLAALSAMERDYIRDRALEGMEGRRQQKETNEAGVADEGMLITALRLREQHLSLREIAGHLFIAQGTKKGQHPSPTTVMRMLRKHDERMLAAKTTHPLDNIENH
ncbi:recombinase family protein [Streptomyces halstedii]